MNNDLDRLSTIRGKAGFMRESDFDPKGPDWSRNGAPIFLGKMFSTVDDYRDSTRPGSLSGKYIDAGLTPYLCSWPAHDLGTWPWAAVFDVEPVISNDGKVIINFERSSRAVEKDTLVFWR
jgi:hypothetical protein